MDKIGRRQWLASTCSLALGLGVPVLGVAQGGPPGPGAPANPPDGSGPPRERWVLLGEKTVDFRVEREVMPVGTHHGAFRHIVFTAEGNDIHLLELTIVLADGTDLVLAYNRTIQSLGSSSVIDIPGEARAIDRIEFTYHSLGRSRRRTTTLRAYGVPD